MSFVFEKSGYEHLEAAALYALQALSASEAAEFEDHLSTCAECLHEIGTLRAVVGSFVSWPTDVLRPSTSLWKRLSQRISEEVGTDPVPPPARPSAKPAWSEVAEGISCKVLTLDPERRCVTMLVRLAAGTDYPPHRHAGIEELHLLHGELMINDKKIHAGEFVRAEAGTVDHRVWSETGCTCLLLTSTSDEIL